MRDVIAVVAHRPVRPRRQIGVLTRIELVLGPLDDDLQRPRGEEQHALGLRIMFGRSLPPPGETSIMYWENVSAKPDSGLANTHSRVPRQNGR